MLSHQIKTSAVVSAFTHLESSLTRTERYIQHSLALPRHQLIHLSVCNQYIYSIHETIIVSYFPLTLSASLFTATGQQMQQLLCHLTTPSAYGDESAMLRDERNKRRARKKGRKTAAHQLVCMLKYLFAHSSDTGNKG